MKNRNLNKIIKLEENGKHVVGFGLKFSIAGYSRGKMILDVINTDKYFYETGHSYQVQRKLNKNTKCFKFDNKLFNVENVSGMDTILSEK